MKPKIIGITGKIGTGKSTVSKYISEKYDYEEYSMAKPLKEIASIFGFNDTQLYGTQEGKLEIHNHWGISARSFLQKFGTEICRKCLPKIIPEMKVQYSLWVDLFKIKYEQNPKFYIISDVRFTDEAQLIRDLNGILIRTIRKNTVSSEDGKEHIHQSEYEQEKIHVDYVLDNDLFTHSEIQKCIDAIFKIENEKYIFANLNEPDKN